MTTTAMKLFHIFLLLVGSISMILSLYSLYLSVEVLYITKKFQKYGLETTAKVLSKDYKRYAGNRGGFNETYSLDLIFDKNSVPTIHRNFYRHVYGKAWHSVGVGDNLDILIIEEGGTNSILLKSFVEDRSTHPLILSHYTGIFLFLTGFGAFYLFRLSGGRFDQPL